MACLQTIACFLLVVAMYIYVPFESVGLLKSIGAWLTIRKSLQVFLFAALFGSKPGRLGHI